MNLRRKSFTLLLFTLLLIVFTGCTEANQLTLEYFVNEDGSGKVEIDFESSLDTDESLHRIDYVDQFLKEESTGLKFFLNKKVKQIIEESEGVVRWTDFSFFLIENENSSDKQRYSIKAKAYFKDITKLDLAVIPDLEIENFDQKHLQWGFPIKNSGYDNISALSEKHTVQESKRIINSLGGVFKTALDNGLELNYIFNLPKEVKSAKAFVENKSDSRQVRLSINEDRVEEIKSRVREGFDIDNKDSLVVPIDVLTQAFFGSKEGMRLELATGLFSGKTKNYVSKDEISAPSDYEIDEVSLPEVRRYEELFVDKGKYFSSPENQIIVIDDTSKLYMDKNGSSLFTGVAVRTKFQDKNSLTGVFEVKSGVPDGAYWGFEDRRLAYKTSVKDGYPTFEIELIRENGSNKRVQKQPLNIKEKWTTKARHLKNIAEDKEYLWITGNGFSLSGLNIVRINKETKETKIFDEFSIPKPANVVYDLIVDAEGKKWVGTDNGLYTFSDDKWEQVSFKELLEQKPEYKNKLFVEELCFNSYDNSIWFLLTEMGHSESLIEIDSTGKFIDHTEFIKNANQGFLGDVNNRTSMACYKNKLCIIDHRGGARIYKFKDGKRELIQLKDENKGIYSFFNFVFDDAGGIWLTSDWELVYFDNDLKLREIIKDDKFEAMHPARFSSLAYDREENKIYFSNRLPDQGKHGSKNNSGGHYLVSYDTNTEESKVFESIENGPLVLSVHLDMNDRVWFTSTRGTISRSNESLSNYEELRYYDIGGIPDQYSLESNESNEIFITDKGNMIYKLDESTKNWKEIELETPNSMRGEILSSSNERWFIPNDRAHKESAVYFWGKDKWIKKDLPELVKNHDFYEGVLNEEGLFLIFKPTKRKFEYELIHLNEENEWEKIHFPFETSVYKDVEVSNSKKDLWVFSNKNGLFKLKENKEWLGYAESRDWYSPSSIIELGKGELILSYGGSFGGSYFKLKTENDEWKEFNFSNTGMQFGLITDAIRDKENRIIIASQSEREGITAFGGRSFGDRSRSTANLMIYDQGNWDVLLAGSKNVNGETYDVQSILLKNNTLFIGTKKNGILEAVLN